MMKIWKGYTNIVRRNCTNPAHEQTALIYWRNDLFANSVIYLLPFCIIALVPGLYWVVKTEQYIIGFVDLLSFATMLLIAFLPGITVGTRKVMFIACVYLFSFSMLYFVGLQGPGLIYLLAASIFSLLIFSNSTWYWPAWINTGCCVLYSLCIGLNLLPQKTGSTASFGEWVAISTNLVFLSFLCTAMIPRLFTSMQTAINRQVALRHDLDQVLIKLQQKNSELEQFAFIASHDLQEPLRMISSFVAQLERKYSNELDDRARQYIHFAVNGAQRMNRIIVDLLEYSRIGKISQPSQPVDVNEMIAELNILYKKEIERKRAVIKADTLPQVFTIRNLLYQVLQNLVGNALKYSKPDVDASIHVTCREMTEHWEFCCSDNGIGIDPEYFANIFIIFQRLHGRDEYSGSGVGLAISKKIIEYLGGKIWVESANGEGSKFYFTILKQKDDQVH